MHRRKAAAASYACPGSLLPLPCHCLQPYAKVRRVRGSVKYVAQACRREQQGSRQKAAHKCTYIGVFFLVGVVLRAAKHMLYIKVWNIQRHVMLYMRRA